MTRVSGFRRAGSRRGIAAALGILVLGIVLIVATVLARQFYIENARENAALLESRHEQCVESLRLLTQREFSTANLRDALEIDLSSMLPAEWRGTARLSFQHLGNRAGYVDCDVQLAGGTQRLTRQSHWALHAPSAATAESP